MTKPRPCARCGVNPIAYPGRACCYECVPRAWKRPPRCKRCGSTADYYTNGRCRRCRRSAPHVAGCHDCLAWGVTRRRGGLCQGYLGWRKRFGEPRHCPSCQRRVVVNARGYCRLCCRQAHLVRSPHRSIDVCEAYRYGQQLFIVDLFRQKRPTPPPSARSTAWPAHYPVAHRQLALFAADRDYASPRGAELAPSLPDLAEALELILGEHAQRHGWGHGLHGNTRGAIRLLLATQDTPGALIKATDAAAVTTGRKLDNLKSVLEILTTARMLEDDREPTLDAYAEHLAYGMADPMAQEFLQWSLVLRDGTTTPPRYRPSGTLTICGHIASAAPILHAWTAAGYHSLREITRQDVLDVLPTNPHRHRKTLGALRALFRFLKGRKLVFINPTARLRSCPVQPNQPLPMDTPLLQDTVNSAKPVQAALGALIAFHALRANEVRLLLLTDLHDGRRLHIDQRTIPLAEPVRVKLRAWLDERARRWPNTINPHLFINLHTAVRTCPTSPEWITATLGVSAQAIREDRILNETLATGGDVRRLGDLFGLTVGGAERYAHTTDQPATSASCGTQANS